MSEIYIAVENIPAGTEVIVQPGYSQYAYGLDPLSTNYRQRSGVVIGRAAEGLREGFKIVARDGKVYEDDA